MKKVVDGKGHLAVITTISVVYSVSKKNSMCRNKSPSQGGGFVVRFLFAGNNDKISRISVSERKSEI
jgi:hypothetical protein